MPQRTKSIQLISIIIVAVMNAFMVIMLAYTLSDAKRHKEQEVKTTLENLTLLLDYTIAATTDKIDLALRETADDLKRELQQHGRLDASEANAMLAARRTWLAEIAELRVTDADGIVRYGAGVAAGGNITYADRDFFIRHRRSNAGLIVTNPIFGRVSKTWVIAFSRRYDFPDGRFAGVISAAVPVSHFARQLSGLDLGPHGVAVLRDADTAVIVRHPLVSAATQQLGAKTFSKELGDLIASGVSAQTYHSTQTADGVERINAYRRLSAVPFHLVAGVGAEDYLAEWRDHLRKAIALAALFFIATMAMAWMLWRSIRLVEKASTHCRVLQQHASDGIHILDATGKLIDASDSFCRMLGYARDELIGMNVHQWDANIPVDALARDIAKAAGQREIVTLETRHRRKDGAILDVEITSYPVDLDDRTVLYASSRDITERKQTEARLQLAANVFTHAREGIAITDAAGDIVEVNDAFVRITGYPRHEVLGQNPRVLKSGRQPKTYYAAMWQSLIEKGYWSGEIWNRRKTGEVYAELLTISAVRDGQGKTQNYVAMFTDITPMKQHQQQLEHIAHYDALTNLPNRVLLADRLHNAVIQSQRRHKSLAVVYLDLDGFKTVNDRYGHDIGDELLIEVARRMKAALREGDTLARIGGDEFVIVLVDLDRAQDCEPVLARLLEASSAPITVGDAMLRVSASIGVTLYPQDGADAEQLIRHADQAMYQAKQAGKNRYYLFDVAEDTAVKTQRESLEHIRQSMDRREFVLHYQPKVNMKTGAVIGVEALIRWQHPERGLLPPAAFLPVIEDHPSSVELGEWVIDAALVQMSAWHAAGLDIAVSVNIGARQLQHADFVTRLSELLAAHPDVNPAQLELEILETSALEDVSKISELMHACLALGVSFALDDFGTGYSSLTYLKHLPAELLKIDQTFVRDMLGDTDDLAIVDAVVGLGTAFRRKVIAEGVETIAHGELLLPLGCELAQGYCIARPMPAADLPGWIAAWRPDAAWTAWRDRTPNRDDLALVFAEVEHRHWMSSIEIFLTGDADATPPLDVHQCRFGLWLEGGGRLRYGESPEFQALRVLHEHVHARARELVDLHVRGRQAEALAQVRELHALRGELIERLRGLMRSVD